MLMTSTGSASARHFSRGLLLLMMIAGSVAMQPVKAELTVSPITWDIVGLDHNRPLTSGPELFPAGARVCTDVATTNIEVELVWESASPYIDHRPGSLTLIEVDELVADECFDAYFEIQLQRSASAFGQSRQYRIEARDGNGAFSSPSPRALYIERLVSQNRNSTQLVRYGQQVDQSDWVPLAGGGLALSVGETYFIELTTQTATAYEQLQSFLTLSNTIFQVKSVETTYSVLTAPPARVPVPNPQLWADGCLWDSDPDSPNYRSCLSSGKAGGVVVTIYEIDIISGGGDTVGLEALIYDRSGGSFHYNTDFTQSLGEAYVVDPAQSGFSKQFLPGTTSIGGISRLRFIMTNPNAVQLTGYSFIDNLPVGVAVADPPNASTSCGGTWNPLAGATALAFDDGIIGAGGSCTLLVDVTSAAEGTYENISENLVVEGEDTGNHAEATLTVNDAPLPPACQPDTELARWTMDPSQGTTTPPAPFAVSPHVATAVASFTGSDLPGVDSINTSVGNPVNSWSGTGWGMATDPVQAGPGPNSPSYFQFELDTSNFASDPSEPIGISIGVNPTPSGNWATEANITVNVHASVDGGPFTTIINANSPQRALWTTLNASVTPGLGNTVFRVNISGRSNGAPSATFLIDNIIFTGCGPGDPADVLDPPSLTKAFSPAVIGAGQSSALTFELTNPNATDALSGVAFDDQLPAGMTVANPANATTTCGGTPNWTPQPGDSVLDFSAGIIPAGSSCTVSVDLTSSVVGVSANISGFIFAAESGQNTGSDGSAFAALQVLAAPVIEKSFDAQLLLLGIDPPDFSVLTFTIINPNDDDAISGAAFEDFFPAGLVVAEPASGPAELALGKALTGQSESPIDTGTILTYTIVATNQDPVMTLTDVVVSDSLVVVNPVDDCVWPLLEGELDAGESVTCTVAYTVTQDDMDSGRVINLASATSTETGSDVARYRLISPLLDSGCGAPVFSPVPGADSVSFSGGTIAAGGTCTVSVPVSGPADVYNNVSEPVSHLVSGMEAYGNTAEATLVIDQPIPGVRLQKQIGFSGDPEGAWSNYLAVEPGAEVYYRLTIENIGETVLDTIDVVDPDIDTSTCVWPAELPVADVGSEDHIAVCIVGPVSADEGVVVNQAEVSALGAGLAVNDSDSATYATIGLTFAKTADPVTFEQSGDVIDYTFTVNNIGFAILAGPVQIGDPLVPGASCPALNTIGNLDNFFGPGESIVCSGSYTIDAADISAGFVTNTASAFTVEALSDPDQATVVLTGVNPELTVSKVLNFMPSPIELGSVLEYTVTVSNTGDATLSDVEVVDPLLTPSSVICATLAVGDSCVLTGTYTVTQADIDSGQIENTGSATSNESAPDADTLITLIDQTPAIALVKTITDGDPYANVGEVITYELTATNNGNVTLSDVIISDPDAAVGVCIPAQPANLAPGDTLVCPASYTVDQGDIDAGSFTNLASVAGIDPNTNPVEDSDSATATGPAAAPALSVLKELTGAPSPIQVGSVLEYTVTATNDGNVTLNNVQVSDSLITPSSTSCLTLAPAADCALVGNYTVTQADVDAGEISNIGSTAADEVPPLDTAPVITSIDQNPAVELAKTITAGDPYADVGDVITYELTATNTGDVTLSNVMISDPAATLGACAPAQPATLAPNETLVCPASYTVGQGDINAGSFTNNASVEAIDPNTDPVSDTDSATAQGPAAAPALDVLKERTDSIDPIEVGSVLEYTITVTNSGNVTLFDIIVADSLVIVDQEADCSWPAVTGELQPTDQVVCTISYTVTQDDIDAGQVTNLGGASAPDPSDPTDPPIENDDEVITPIAQNGTIELAKLITGGDPYAEVGDTITYELTATNTGNVTLTAVAISDPDAVLGTCAPAQPASLAPGESLICAASYAVTQDDLFAGSFTNLASVSAMNPNGDSVEDTDSAVATGPAAQPAIGLDKQLVNPPNPILVGSVLNYVIAATNIGNVTLSDVIVEDEMITPSSETCATLNPGQTCVLSGSYTVTGADLAAGALVNVAVVGANDPDETPLPEVTVTLSIVMGEPVPVPTVGSWALWLMAVFILLAGMIGVPSRVRRSALCPE